MKKYLLTTVLLCAAFCLNAQVRLSTNGTTFEVAQKSSIDSAKTSIAATLAVAQAARDSILALKARVATSADIPEVWFDYTFVKNADTISVQGFKRMSQAARLALVSPTPGRTIYQTDNQRGIWIYKEEGWLFWK